MKAVIYARVSSKEQEKEGFSIPAQLKYLNEYAKQKGFEVVRQYSDSETAKKTGRTNFNKMLDFFKLNADVRVLLVEKTDRLYRNFKDYVILEDYDLEVHLAKEGSIISKQARSHDKFIHGIKVLMAKNYIDNLSEEVTKGFREAVDQGIWPFKVPYGYYRGKHKEVLIDDKPSAFVKRAFELYATNNWSIRALVEMLYDEGYCFKPHKSKISKTALEGMLKNPFYKGYFVYKDEVFKASHEPIITPETFEKAQTAFRKDNKPKYARLEMFAYANLIKCGECGYTITAEYKKDKYIYYHCTGTDPNCSQRHYIREEELTEKFTRAIKRIAMTQEHFEWVKEALKQSLQDQTGYHNQQVAIISDRIKALKGKLSQMYVDKLEGNIDNDLWKEFKNQWQLELNELNIRLEKHESANINYMDYGVRILDTCAMAERIHKTGKLHHSKDTNALLQTIIKACTLKNGRLYYSYEEPFAIVAKGLSCTKNWAILDSNQ